MARILTGDTPTGKLHLGHLVGSVENRVALQGEYDCFFIIANKHAFTTRSDRPDDIRQSVIEIATDYLACGIDPNVSAMFVQSEVPAIDELTFFFAMLLPFNRVMRNPTLKDEIRDKVTGTKAPAAIQEYLKKLRSQAFIQVSPGYEDTGTVPNVIVADSKQTAQYQSGKDKKDKKKK